VVRLPVAAVAPAAVRSFESEYTPCAAGAGILQVRV